MVGDPSNGVYSTITGASAGITGGTIGGWLMEPHSIRAWEATETRDAARASITATIPLIERDLMGVETQPSAR
jgi:hypothetical protein